MIIGNQPLAFWWHEAIVVLDLRYLASSHLLACAQPPATPVTVLSPFETPGFSFVVNPTPQGVQPACNEVTLGVRLLMKSSALSCHSQLTQSLTSGLRSGCISHVAVLNMTECHCCLATMLSPSCHCSSRQLTATTDSRV